MGEGRENRYLCRECYLRSKGRVTQIEWEKQADRWQEQKK